MNQELQNDFEQKVKARRPAIIRFIETQLAENKADADFWIAFSNQIDIHFSENDDDTSEDFGKMEFFAYPISFDRNRNSTTDTSIFVEIKYKLITQFTVDFERLVDGEYEPDSRDFFEDKKESAMSFAGEHFQTITYTVKDEANDFQLIDYGYVSVDGTLSSTVVSR